jgi:tripartite-type tricarboxylate transporter receptor subunit TctC
MRSLKSLSRRGCLAAAALALLTPLAHAGDAFPAHPIKLEVGYGAGGGVDAMARLLAQRLPAILGQQVIVENRSGASGMIAAEYVAKAPADGYTLLMGESGMLITSQLQPRAGFDPIKSFAPVAGVFVAPLMIIANNNFPAKDPKELISVLKANPGKYSYGSPGVGTVHQLGFELMKAKSGTFVLHIPYRGASQIIPDVISGQIPLGVVSASAGLAQARAGKVRAIGLMDTSKLPGAEDVPSIAGALPGFEVAPRLMVLAPAGTPADVVEKLNDAVHKVLANKAVDKLAGTIGAIPAYLPPAQLTAAMTKEYTDWSHIIQAQKISLK